MVLVVLQESEVVLGTWYLMPEALIRTTLRKIFCLSFKLLDNDRFKIILFRCEGAVLCKFWFYWFMFCARFFGRFVMFSTSINLRTPPPSIDQKRCVSLSSIEPQLFFNVRRFQGLWVMETLISFGTLVPSLDLFLLQHMSFHFCLP